MQIEKFYSNSPVIKIAIELNKCAQGIPHIELQRKVRSTVVDAIQKLSSNPLVQPSSRERTEWTRLLQAIKKNKLFKEDAELLEKALQNHLPKLYLKRDYTSITQLFGKERIQRLALRYSENQLEINLEKIKKRGYVSDEEFEILFIASSDVRKEDCEDLLKLINDIDTKTIFHLSEEETVKLRQNFLGARINSLSKEELEQFMDVLSPLKGPEDLVFHKHLDIPDICPDSGKRLEGIRERVYLQQELRFLCKETDNSHSNKQLLQWASTIGKRINNREPPQGVLIPSPKGYYAVHQTLTGEGAYVILLKTFTKKENGFVNTLSCRGTRVQKSATEAFGTVRDDMRRQVGAKGIVAIEKELNAYLTDVQKGFIDDEKEGFDVIGFSLGGATSQLITALHPLRVNILISICGASLSKDIAENFNRQLQDRDDNHPIRIIHLIDAGDPVHATGKVKLGWNAPKDKAHVQFYGLITGGNHVENKTNDQILKSFKRPPSAFGALKHFFVNIKGPHVQNAFGMDDYVIVCVDNQSQQDKINEIFHNKKFDKVGFRIFERRRVKMIKCLEKYRIRDPRAEANLRYVFSKRHAMQLKSNEIFPS
jgi:hypothetical protein